MEGRTFLFCSNRALYGPWLRAAEILVEEYGLRGHVIAPTEYKDSPLWEAGRRSGDGEPRHLSSVMEVHLLPPRNNNVDRYGFDGKRLGQTLRDVRPDYIYVQGEFWEGISHQFLAYYRFARRPRIVAYVAINHSKLATPLFSRAWPFVSRTRLRQKVLWPRLDGVCACATKSMECARRLGLPWEVPVIVNYLPVLGPEDATHQEPALSWRKGGDLFSVGFVGTLNRQKGWRVLLSAMEALPDRFRVIVVGDGEDREEFLSWIERPSLKGRVHYAGILQQEKLLAVYPALDVLVLPSITTDHSVEQFGAVLAEAMACGVVTIGSDSGGIPETIGKAGLVVPEQDAVALAQAIRLTGEDEALRKRCIARGREQYQTHYSCRAYAHSVARLLGIADAG